MSLTQKFYGTPVQDTLSAYRQSFASEWQRSTQEAEHQATYTLQQSEVFYNTDTFNLPNVQIGSSVALQNPHTKLWDIYSTVVDISPHRRYYVHQDTQWLSTRMKPLFSDHETSYSCITKLSRDSTVIKQHADHF